MIYFKVETEEFEEWVYTARSRFETMVLTMIDVAELIHANTYMRVPLDTGRLEESFHWVLREENPNSIIVDIIYDAEDPRNGFHYAEVQHQNARFNHPKRGEAFYLYKGIQASRSMAYQIIETDYMSLFGTFKGGY
jgi:hypothetical protein